jgi:hypothetical protein
VFHRTSIPGLLLHRYSELLALAGALECENCIRQFSASRLCVGAAKDARLTIARVDATGKLTQIAQVPTREGARNGVVTKEGTVYLAHSQRGQFAGLIVVSPSKK